MKQFPLQRFFRERRQAIPGKKLDKPGDLGKFLKTGRLPAAPGDLTGLKNINYSTFLNATRVSDIGFWNLFFQFMTVPKHYQCKELYFKKQFNPSRPVLGRREKKLTYIFISSLLCGDSQGFMTTLKHLIKSFVAS